MKAENDSATRQFYEFCLRCDLNVSAPTLLSQNITLVYEALDLETIDSSKLKGFLGTPTVLMDTPDMIVALHHPIPLIVQIGDRRIRITVQKQEAEIGEGHLWDIAHRCNGLVAQSQLIAYGFNYDTVVLVSDGNPHELVKRFISNQEAIEDLVDGEIWSFTPRFKFRRGDTLYDLILEPLDEHKIKAHLNVHFSSRGLPPQDQLEMSFREQFAHLAKILPNLLCGESQE